MFIPCDHCLRKHAIHMVYSRVEGKEELLQLCGECYRRFRQNSLPAPSSPPDLRGKEQQIAEELQASLLPRRVPQVPGFDVSAYFRPARNVGADYYDFIDIDSD